MLVACASKTLTTGIPGPEVGRDVLAPAPAAMVGIPAFGLDISSAVVPLDMDGALLLVVRITTGVAGAGRGGGCAFRRNFALSQVALL